MEVNAVVLAKEKGRVIHRENLAACCIRHPQSCYSISQRVSVPPLVRHLRESVQGGGTTSRWVLARTTCWALVDVMERNTTLPRLYPVAVLSYRPSRIELRISQPSGALPFVGSLVFAGLRC